MAAAGDWLPAARAGSREALGEALETYRGILLRLAEREIDADLRGKGGASDLVQQTFLDAQRLFPRFEGTTDGEWQAWLRQLLVYNAADFTRRFRAGKRNAAREAPLPESSLGLPSGLPADFSTPSVVASEAEQEAALARALARLQDDYREVLRLRYEEELTFEEIGQRLGGRTPNAARKLWTRAVHELEREMRAPP
jgi:RNA polymerase sigma-70 factor (ECF subfamily)